MADQTPDINQTYVFEHKNCALEDNYLAGRRGGGGFHTNDALNSRCWPLYGTDIQQPPFTYVNPEVYRVFKKSSCVCVKLG